ncbi:MAG: GNAT family N-acetyltransferase [Anaerolineaceae bacterium]|nr:GNAT family N-acetyltransferase [Anaerolineaceae bacterium]
MGNRPFRFFPIDEASVRLITEWHYAPPYDTYNIATENLTETVNYFLDPEYAYHIIKDENDDLTAFCTFGSDAQVPGGDYSEDALDIGIGVRPDLTGRGKGHVFIQSVFDFALEKYKSEIVRVTIAEFNKRAIRVWEKAGFQHVQSFHRTYDDKPFLILTAQV